jgi:HNH endonuclease/AP2 domain
MPMHPAERTCQRCGTEFVSPQPFKSYCTRRCQKRATKARARARSTNLTPGRLRELLAYDLETGIFRWRVSRGSRSLIGSVAGYLHRDCRYINMGGRNYRAHRLAWLYVHSEWPTGGLDHKDTNPTNNAITNLRLNTQPQNRANSRRRKDNKSGFKGVSWDRRKRRWRTRITANSRRRDLGRFLTPERAHEAYCRAAHKLHGEFARAAKRRVWR